MQSRHDSFSSSLEQLASSGNLRRIPDDTLGSTLIDLTSNDYLGISERVDWQQQFISDVDFSRPQLTSSASRLLASRQQAYAALESQIADLYGRKALLFNSGYHANTGIIAAIADSGTLILADRLVHASIIDGIMLSKAQWRRFRHNDVAHLQQLIERDGRDFSRILIIVESVYSMDGDSPDLQAIADLRNRDSRIMLYVDEAHAFGVEGPGGLGLSMTLTNPHDADIVIVTLGKAAASQGAFAVMSTTLHDYLVNRARSLIFSTALPPISALWSSFVIDRITAMDTERRHLHTLADALAHAIGEVTPSRPAPSHILPLVVGDAQATVALSQGLLRAGIKVLPIRTPTVPPGTERLRFSLSAALSPSHISRTTEALHKAWLTPFKQL